MRTRKTFVSVAVVAGLPAPALPSADGHVIDHREHQALAAAELTTDQRLVQFTLDRPARTTKHRKGVRSAR